MSRLASTTDVEIHISGIFILSLVFSEAAKIAFSLVFLSFFVKLEWNRFTLALISEFFISVYILFAISIELQTTRYFFTLSHIVSSNIFIISSDCKFFSYTFTLCLSFPLSEKSDVFTSVPSIFSISFLTNGGKVAVITATLPPKVWIISIA